MVPDSFLFSLQKKKPLTSDSLSSNAAHYVLGFIKRLSFSSDYADFFAVLNFIKSSRVCFISNPVLSVSGQQTQSQNIKKILDSISKS